MLSTNALSLPQRLMNSGSRITLQDQYSHTPHRPALILKRLNEPGLLFFSHMPHTFSSPGSNIHTHDRADLACVTIPCSALFSPTRYMSSLKCVHIWKWECFHLSINCFYIDETQKDNNILSQHLLDLTISLLFSYTVLHFAYIIFTPRVKWIFFPFWVSAAK